MCQLNRTPVGLCGSRLFVAGLHLSDFESDDMELR